MVVPVRAVHVAVRQLFGRGGPNRLHGGGKADRVAGQRVVAVQVHFGALILTTL